MIDPKPTVFSRLALCESNQLDACAFLFLFKLNFSTWNMEDKINVRIIAIIQLSELDAPTLQAEYVWTLYWKQPKPICCTLDHKQYMSHW